MATPQPEEEAQDILHVIDKYFPKIFESRESIKWLHRHTTKGGEREWQAFFFEEYSRPLLTNFLGGWHGARIIKSSRIDYQRFYNWDLKVHSIKNKNNQFQHDIPLNDKDSMDRIISTEFGLGFVICYVDFTFDTKLTLLKWRDKYEERTKPHSKKTRIMKNKGTVIDLRAIFLKDTKMVKEGISEGWMKIFNQGKQQTTGAPRKPKYMIDLSKVPDELFIHLI
ncbi:MAG: hypothetical protein PVJ16_04285 [Nitrosopumilaceae archaeon]|jgi:hypothetical protein